MRAFAPMPLALLVLSCTVETKEPRDCESDVPGSLEFDANPLVEPEPGTIIARSPSFTLRPSITLATSRRSSMRAFVHEPMNTVSISTSCSLVPGVRPI